MDYDNKFYMAGTEGTGEYLVLAVTPRGRLGYRTLSSGRSRVRIEPAKEAHLKRFSELEVLEAWKKPDSQRRFSVMTFSSEGLTQALKTGLVVIGAGIKGTEINSDAPVEFRELVPTALGPLARLRNWLKKMVASSEAA